MDVDLDRNGSKRKAKPAGQQIAITLRADIFERLIRRAKQRGLSRSACVAFLVTEGLDRWDQTEKEKSN